MANRQSNEQLQDDPLAELRTFTQQFQEEDPLSELRTFSESFSAETTPPRLDPVSPGIFSDFRRAGPVGVIRGVFGRRRERAEEAAPARPEEVVRAPGPPIIEREEIAVMEIGEREPERPRGFPDVGMRVPPMMQSLSEALGSAQTSIDIPRLAPVRAPELRGRMFETEAEATAREETEFQAGLVKAGRGVSSDQPITDEPLPEVPTLRELINERAGAIAETGRTIANTFTERRDSAPGDVFAQADALNVKHVEPERPGPRFRRPRSPEEMTAALDRARVKDTEALQKRYDSVPLPVRMAHSAARGAFEVVTLGRVDELVAKANGVVAAAYGLDAPALTTEEVFARVDRGLLDKGAGGAGFLLAAGGTFAATNRLVAGLAPHLTRSGTSARVLLESFDPTNPQSIGVRALQGAIEGVPFDLLFEADSPQERMFNVAAGLVIGAIVGPIFGATTSQLDELFTTPGAREAVRADPLTGAIREFRTRAAPTRPTLDRPIREVLEDVPTTATAAEAQPGPGSIGPEVITDPELSGRRGAGREGGRRIDELGQVPDPNRLSIRERVTGTRNPARDIEERTGLLNQTAFERALVRVQGPKDPTTQQLIDPLAGDPNLEVLMFDLVNFKSVNDLISMAAGDRKLREVADIIRDHSGISNRQIFRAGGDEFGLIVRTGEGEAIGRRIQEIVGSTRIGDSEFRFGIRFGVGQSDVAANVAVKAAQAAERGPRFRGAGGRRAVTAADPGDVTHTRTSADQLNPEVEVRTRPTPDGPAGSPEVRPRTAADPRPSDTPAGVQADGRGGFFDVGMVGQARRAAGGFLRRNFTSAGDLPDRIFRLKLQASQWVSAQMGEVRFTLRKYDEALEASYGTSNPSQEVKDQVLQTLRGQLPVEQLPAPMRPVIIRMREQVDALSSQFMESGMVRGELVPVIADNMGVYLSRSYQVFDDPSWILGNIPEDIVNAAHSWIRSERPDLNEGQIKGIIEGILNKEVDSPLAFLTAGTLGSKDLSMLIKRKDIHPSIRALMGEHTDVRLNYARTVTRMTNTLANHEFLSQVARDHTGTPGRAGGFFFQEREVRGNQRFITQIAATGSDVMAPLNGLYTTPEIAKAFESAFSRITEGTFFGAYMKANGLVKFDKTVLSLMTHNRNLIGNLGFAVANGHWRLNHFGRSIQAVNASLGATRAVRRAASRVPGVEIAAPRARTAAETSRLERQLRLSAQGAEAFFTPWERYYTKLQALGVVDSSAHAGELADIIKDASRIGLDNVTPDENLLVKAARQGLTAVTDLYRAEDDLWKVVAFENEFARYRKALPGLSEQEIEETAAWIVRNTYPTYSMVPAGVKAFRRNILVGSFTSFPAEVFRTLYHTMSIGLREASSANPELRRIGAERLAGLAVAGMGVHGAAMASRWMNGVSKKEDRDLRPFLAPWSRNSSLIYTSAAEDGVYKYIDLSYTDPYSYVRDPIRALFLGEDWQTKLMESTIQAAAPFFSEEILIGKLADWKRNTTPSGRQVFNPEDHILDQSVSVFNHLWDALEPGTITSARRIARGLTGETSQTGATFDARTEAMAVLTGHRLQTTDVRQSLGFRTGEMTRRIRDANRIMTTVGTRRGTVSPEEMTEAFMESERSREKVFEDAHQIAQAAIRLGMTSREVIKAFRDGGLNQNDARAVVDGDRPPRRQLNSNFRDRNLLIRRLNQGR